jgi:hypothetical protein
MWHVCARCPAVPGASCSAVGYCRFVYFGIIPTATEPMADCGSLWTTPRDMRSPMKICLHIARRQHCTGGFIRIGKMAASKRLRATWWKEHLWFMEDQRCNRGRGNELHSPTKHPCQKPAARAPELHPFDCGSTTSMSASKDILE